MDIVVWSGIAIALLAILIPVIRFVRTNVLPRSIVFIDHDGRQLGEISPKRVHETDLKELERLHERVRRDRHLRIRTVA
jgi:hypothetical protein